MVIKIREKAIRKILDNMIILIRKCREIWIKFFQRENDIFCKFFSTCYIYFNYKSTTKFYKKLYIFFSNNLLNKINLYNYNL